MRVKKIVCFLVMAFLLNVNCFAVSWGRDYPSYVDQSAAAFIECQTVLGKGSIILPLNYQENTIGFYGSGNNLCNLLSSTVNGIFVTESGNQYTVRATRNNYFEYSTSSGYSTYYTDLNVTQIYNSNVQIYDFTGSGRGYAEDRLQDSKSVLIVMSGVFVLAAVVYYCKRKVSI